MSHDLDLIPLCPFPPIPWWGMVLGGGVGLDGLEHYQKRSFRNRYTIMSSTGTLNLTVPVEKRGGNPRPQHQTLRVTGEPDRKAWQAVKTAYGRAPYFEEMAQELESLFLRGPENLGDWNLATVDWASSWLGIERPALVTEGEYQVQDHGHLMMQLMASASVMNPCRWPHVWGDRNEEIPFVFVGILDALLHLGPEAVSLIRPVPQSGSQRPG